MDVRQTWTDRDEAGDYVVANVLSPRDLVSTSDRMDETAPHTSFQFKALQFTPEFSKIIFQRQYLPKEYEAKPT